MEQSCHCRVDGIQVHLLCGTEFDRFQGIGQSQVAVQQHPRGRDAATVWQGESMCLDRVLPRELKCHRWASLQVPIEPILLGDHDRW